MFVKNNEAFAFSTDVSQPDRYRNCLFYRKLVLDKPKSFRHMFFLLRIFIYIKNSKQDQKAFKIYLSLSEEKEMFTNTSGNYAWNV